MENIPGGETGGEEDRKGPVQQERLEGLILCQNSAITMGGRGESAWMERK